MIFDALGRALAQLLETRGDQRPAQAAQAFGRVIVGKSASLNALLGALRCSTSPPHGETKSAQMGQWEAYDAGVSSRLTPLGSTRSPARPRRP